MDTMENIVGAQFAHSITLFLIRHADEPFSFMSSEFQRLYHGLALPDVGLVIASLLRFCPDALSSASKIVALFILFKEYHFERVPEHHVFGPTFVILLRNRMVTVDGGELMPLLSATEWSFLSYMLQNGVASLMNMIPVHILRYQYDLSSSFDFERYERKVISFAIQHFDCLPEIEFSRPQMAARIAEYKYNAIEDRQHDLETIGDDLLPSDGRTTSWAFYMTYRRVNYIAFSGSEGFCGPNSLIPDLNISEPVVTDQQSAANRSVVSFSSWMQGYNDRMVPTPEVFPYAVHWMQPQQSSTAGNGRVSYTSQRPTGNCLDEQGDMANDYSAATTILRELDALLADELTEEDLMVAPRSPPSSPSVNRTDQPALSSTTGFDESSGQAAPLSALDYERLSNLLAIGSLRSLTIADQTYLRSLITTVNGDTLMEVLNEEVLVQLVVWNPNLAASFLCRFIETGDIDSYLERLLYMPLSLNLLDVISQVSLNVALPTDYLRTFLVHCYGSCEHLKNVKGTVANRLAILVSSFTESVLQRRLLEPMEITVEAVHFCLSFSDLSHMNSLYRLLNSGGA